MESTPILNYKYIVVTENEVYTGTCNYICKRQYLFIDLVRIDLKFNHINILYPKIFCDKDTFYKIHLKID
jgi:hypothetical protein